SCSPRASTRCSSRSRRVPALSCRGPSSKKSSMAGATASKAMPSRFTSAHFDASWEAISSAMCAACVGCWHGPSPKRPRVAIDRAMPSIRRELLLWLLVGLSLAILGAAIGTYLRARDEANSLFDYQLREMAASLIDAPFAPAPTGALGGATGDDALIVQIWGRNGVELYLSQP